MPKGGILQICALVLDSWDFFNNDLLYRRYLGWLSSDRGTWPWLHRLPMLQDVEGFGDRTEMQDHKDHIMLQILKICRLESLRPWWGHTSRTNFKLVLLMSIVVLFMSFSPFVLPVFLHCPWFRCCDMI